MGVATETYQRFVSRVHRRYVLMHTLEHGVLGLLLGVVAAVPLVSVLVWRNVPSAKVAIALPLLALGFGLTQGFVTRPTRLQAAAEADEQFQLSDLLSSAIAVSNSTDWASVIRSYANAMCGRLSASDVILHRLGVRVWAGAALASALLFAIALLPTAGRMTIASSNAGGEVLSSPAELSQAASVPRSTVVQREADSAEQSRYGDPASPVRQHDPEGAEAGSNPESSSGLNGASGTGQSSSDSVQADRPRLGASTTAERAGEHAVVGGGAESEHGLAVRSASSAEAAGAAGPHIPPWKSTSWSTQVSRVESELRAGHIPDRYRDVISGYFDSR